MFLVIDIGNTLRKAAVFDKDGLVIAQCHWETMDELQQFLAPHAIQACIVSSVREDGSQLAAELNRCFPTMLFTSLMPLPISLRYDTPQTLGTDRIASAVGAHALFPEGSSTRRELRVTRVKQDTERAAPQDSRRRSLSDLIFRISRQRRAHRYCAP